MPCNYPILWCLTLPLYIQPHIRTDVIESSYIRGANILLFTASNCWEWKSQILLLNAKECEIWQCFITLKTVVRDAYLMLLDRGLSLCPEARFCHAGSHQPWYINGHPTVQTYLCWTAISHTLSLLVVFEKWSISLTNHFVYC